MKGTKPFSMNWPLVSHSALCCFYKLFLEGGERMGDATTMNSGVGSRGEEDLFTFFFVHLLLALLKFPW